MMIDTHIHLDQYPRAKLPRLIADWQTHGVTGVVAVSTDVRSSYNILDLSVQFPHFVYPCIGWHPEQRLPTEKETIELMRLIEAEHERLVGVGEIGLPYYALDQLENPSLEPYIEQFTAFVIEARKKNLPVNIHAVYEHAEIAYEILKREQIKKAQFHWLKADEKLIKKISAARYYCSLTPEVCYRKRDRDLVFNVPLEQLLVETDGPWEFAGPFTGRSTTPRFINKSLTKLAELKNKTVERVKQQVYENSLTLYKRIQGG